jgi:hypothetical protein
VPEVGSVSAAAADARLAARANASAVFITISFR